MRHSYPASLGALAVTLLASCSGTVSNRAAQTAPGQCGHLGTDDIPWRAAPHVPEVAPLLVGLVRADVDAYRAELRRPVETWFEGSSGELMLCITPTSPSASLIGGWWSFRKAGDEWRTFQDSEWITLQD